MVAMKRSWVKFCEHTLNNEWKPDAVGQRTKGKSGKARFGSVPVVRCFNVPKKGVRCLRLSSTGKWVECKKRSRSLSPGVWEPSDTEECALAKVAKELKLSYGRKEQSGGGGGGEPSQPRRDRGRASGDAHQKASMPGHCETHILDHMKCTCAACMNFACQWRQNIKNDLKNRTGNANGCSTKKIRRWTSKVGGHTSAFPIFLPRKKIVCGADKPKKKKKYPYVGSPQVNWWFGVHVPSCDSDDSCSESWRPRKFWQRMRSCETSDDGGNEYENDTVYDDSNDDSFEGYGIDAERIRAILGKSQTSDGKVSKPVAKTKNVESTSVTGNKGCNQSRNVEIVKEIVENPSIVQKMRSVVAGKGDKSHIPVPQVSVTCLSPATLKRKLQCDNDLAEALDDGALKDHFQSVTCANPASKMLNTGVFLECKSGGVKAKKEQKEAQIHTPSASSSESFPEESTANVDGRCSRKSNTASKSYLDLPDCPENMSENKKIRRRANIRRVAGEEYTSDQMHFIPDNLRTAIDDILQRDHKTRSNNLAASTGRMDVNGGKVRGKSCQSRKKRKDKMCAIDTWTGNVSGDGDIDNCQDSLSRGWNMSTLSDTNQLLTKYGLKHRKDSHRYLTKDSRGFYHLPEVPHQEFFNPHTRSKYYKNLPDLKSKFFEQMGWKEDELGWNEDQQRDRYKEKRDKHHNNNHFCNHVQEIPYPQVARKISKSKGKNKRYRRQLSHLSGHCQEELGTARHDLSKNNSPEVYIHRGHCSFLDKLMNEKVNPCQSPEHGSQIKTNSVVKCTHTDSKDMKTSSRSRTIDDSKTSLSTSEDCRLSSMLRLSLGSPPPSSPDMKHASVRKMLEQGPNSFHNIDKDRVLSKLWASDVPLNKLIADDERKDSRRRLKNSGSESSTETNGHDSNAGNCVENDVVECSEAFVDKMNPQYELLTEKEDQEDIKENRCVARKESYIVEHPTCFKRQDTTQKSDTPCNNDSTKEAHGPYNQRSFNEKQLKKTLCKARSHNMSRLPVRASETNTMKIEDCGGERAAKRPNCCGLNGDNAKSMDETGNCRVKVSQKTSAIERVKGDGGRGLVCERCVCEQCVCGSCYECEYESQEDTVHDIDDPCTATQSSSVESDMDSCDSQEERDTGLRKTFSGKVSRTTSEGVSAERRSFDSKVSKAVAGGENEVPRRIVTSRTANRIGSVKPSVGAMKPPQSGLKSQTKGLKTKLTSRADVGNSSGDRQRPTTTNRHQTYDQAVDDESKFREGGQNMSECSGSKAVSRSQRAKPAGSYTKPFPMNRVQIAKSFANERQSRAQSFGNERLWQTQCFCHERQSQAKSFGNERKSHAQSFGNERQPRAKSLGNERQSRAKSLGNERQSRAKSLGNERQPQAKSLGNERQPRAKSLGNERQSRAKSLGNERQSRAKSFGNERQPRAASTVSCTESVRGASSSNRQFKSINRKSGAETTGNTRESRALSRAPSAGKSRPTIKSQSTKAVGVTGVSGPKSAIHSSRIRRDTKQQFRATSSAQSIRSLGSEKSGHRNGASNTGPFSDCQQPTSEVRVPRHHTVVDFVQSRPMSTEHSTEAEHNIASRKSLGTVHQTVEMGVGKSSRSIYTSSPKSMNRKGDNSAEPLETVNILGPVGPDNYRVPMVEVNIYGPLEGCSNRNAWVSGDSNNPRLSARPSSMKSGCIPPDPTPTHSKQNNLIPECQINNIKNSIHSMSTCSLDSASNSVEESPEADSISESDYSNLTYMCGSCRDASANNPQVTVSHDTSSWGEGPPSDTDEQQAEVRGKIANHDDRENCDNLIDLVKIENICLEPVQEKGSCLTQCDGSTRQCFAGEKHKTEIPLVDALMVRKQKTVVPLISELCQSRFQSTTIRNQEVEKFERSRSICRPWKDVGEREDNGQGRMHTFSKRSVSSSPLRLKSNETGPLVKTPCIIESRSRSSSISLTSRAQRTRDTAINVIKRSRSLPLPTPNVKRKRKIKSSCYPFFYTDRRDSTSLSQTNCLSNKPPAIAKTIGPKPAPYRRRQTACSAGSMYTDTLRPNFLRAERQNQNCSNKITKLNDQGPVTDPRIIYVLQTNQSIAIDQKGQIKAATEDFSHQRTPHLTYHDSDCRKIIPQMVTEFNPQSSTDATSAKESMSWSSAQLLHQSVNASNNRTSKNSGSSAKHIQSSKSEIGRRSSIERSLPTVGYRVLDREDEPLVSSQPTARMTDEVVYNASPETVHHTALETVHHTPPVVNSRYLSWCQMMMTSPRRADHHKESTSGKRPSDTETRKTKLRKRQSSSKDILSSQGGSSMDMSDYERSLLPGEDTAPGIAVHDLHDGYRCCCTERCQKDDAPFHKSYELTPENTHLKPPRIPHKNLPDQFRQNAGLGEARPKSDHEKIRVDNFKHLPKDQEHLKSKFSAQHPHSSAPLAHFHESGRGFVSLDNPNIEMNWGTQQTKTQFAEDQVKMGDSFAHRDSEDGLVRENKESNQDAFHASDRVLGSSPPKSESQWQERHTSLMDECSQETLDNSWRRVNRLQSHTKVLEGTISNLKLNFKDIENQLDKVENIQNDYIARAEEAVELVRAEQSGHNKVKPPNRSNSNAYGSIKEEEVTRTRCSNRKVCLKRKKVLLREKGLPNTNVLINAYSENKEAGGTSSGYYSNKNENSRKSIHSKYDFSNCNEKEQMSSSRFNTIYTSCQESQKQGKIGSRRKQGASAKSECKKCNVFFCTAKSCQASLRMRSEKDEIQRQQMNPHGHENNINSEKGLKLRLKEGSTLDFRQRDNIRRHLWREVGSRQELEEARFGNRSDNNNKNRLSLDNCRQRVVERDGTRGGSVRYGQGFVDQSRVKDGDSARVCMDNVDYSPIEGQLLRKIDDERNDDGDDFRSSLERISRSTLRQMKYAEEISQARQTTRDHIHESGYESDFSRPSTIPEDPDEAMENLRKLLQDFVQRKSKKSPSTGKRRFVTSMRFLNRVYGPVTSRLRPTNKCFKTPGKYSQINKKTNLTRTDNNQRGEGSCPSKVGNNTNQTGDRIKSDKAKISRTVLHEVQARKCYKLPPKPPIFRQRRRRGARNGRDVEARREYSPLTQVGRGETMLSETGVQDDMEEPENNCRSLDERDNDSVGDAWESDVILQAEDEDNYIINSVSETLLDSGNNTNRLMSAYSNIGEDGFDSSLHYSLYSPPPPPSSPNEEFYSSGFKGDCWTSIERVDSRADYKPPCCNSNIDSNRDEGFQNSNIFCVEDLEKSGGYKLTNDQYDPWSDKRKDKYRNVQSTQAPKQKALDSKSNGTPKTYKTKTKLHEKQMVVIQKCSTKCGSLMKKPVVEQTNDKVARASKEVCKDTPVATQISNRQDQAGISVEVQVQSNTKDSSGNLTSQQGKDQRCERNKESRKRAPICKCFFKDCGHRYFPFNDLIRSKTEVKHINKVATALSKSDISVKPDHESLQGRKTRGKTDASPYRAKVADRDVCSRSVREPFSSFTPLLLSFDYEKWKRKLVHTAQTDKVFTTRPPRSSQDENFVLNKDSTRNMASITEKKALNSLRPKSADPRMSYRWQDRPRNYNIKNNNYCSTKTMTPMRSLRPRSADPRTNCRSVY